MGNHDAPGVYVEEVPGGARPITPVGTSIAGFVGRAPHDKCLDQAVAVNNWTDFLKHFCESPGTPLQRDSPLARAVYGFFENGGGRCYVVNVGDSNSITGIGGRRTGLDLLEPYEEIAIVAAPGFHLGDSHNDLLNYCNNRSFPMAILDGPSEVDAIEDLKKPAVTIGGQSGPPAAKPNNKPVESPPDKTSDKASDKDNGRDTAGESTEASDQPAPAGGARIESTGGGQRPAPSTNGAFYFPWIKVKDPITGDAVDTPPSGHIAGVWARTDALRGVHKAPANEPLRGAVGLTQQVTSQQQAQINREGVNCIRLFAFGGIRVWGARTLADPTAKEWQYINVRRLFKAIGRSIELGTGWMVFEPNDYTLWRSIRRDISTYLTAVWRDGALLGRTPQEAFFVKCDEETNPPDKRADGEVVALVGLAMVRPAEFVVFRLSQWEGGSQTEVVGG